MAMDELEEKIIREHMYNEHSSRMLKVKKTFNFVYYSCFFGNIVVAVNCITYLYLWQAYLIAGLKFNKEMMLDHTIVIAFPAQALILPVSIAVAVLTFLGNFKLQQKFNKAASVILILLAIFGFANLLIGFEPMTIMGMVAMISYALICLVIQYLAIRKYSELEYLQKQEGYPNFNIAIDYDNHSKYVKDRNRWLAKKKEYDYYTDRERPADDISVEMQSQESRMEGISAGENVISQWFARSDEIGAVQPSAVSDMDDMDEELSEIELDESDYIIEDIRKKPLL